MAEVLFSAADVVDPLHGPANNRAALPFDVCYRGLAPGEGRIVVSADEGDEPPANKTMQTMKRMFKHG